jgi:hypothetical protein
MRNVLITLSLLFAACHANSDGTESLAVEGAPTLSIQGPSPISAGACTEYTTTVTYPPAVGTVQSPTDISLTSSPHGAFYSLLDVRCQGPHITSVTLPVGATQVSYRFMDTTAEVATLTSSAVGMSPGSLAVTVNAAYPHQLLVTTPAQTLVVSQCSKAVGIAANDAYGNPAVFPMGANLQLTSSGSAPLSFFSDSACTLSETYAPVQRGYGTTSFFFNASAPGDGTGAFSVSTSNVLPAQQSVTVTQWHFAQSGMWGGGGENALAADPLTPGAFMTGTDIGGRNVSIDDGATFVPADEGAVAGGQTHITALAYSDLDAGTVYAGTAATQGFWVSYDRGEHWSNSGAGLDFYAGATQPRQVGRRIIPDDTHGFIYAGAQDVERTSNGGQSWKTLWSADAGCDPITGLAYDATGEGTLYVATRSGLCSGVQGIYRIGNVRKAQPDPAVSLSASPPNVEELTFTGTTLYAAANTDGVFAMLADGGFAPVEGNASLLHTGTMWTAIDGYNDGSGDVLVAGTFHGHGQEWCDQGESHCRNIAKSLDSGKTWTWLTNGTQPNDDVWGTQEPWWLSNASVGFMMGEFGYGVNQLEIDPTNPQRIFSAGMSGDWRSDDFGDHWQPIVAGMSGIIVIDVATGANGQTSVACMDWGFIDSSNHLDSVDGGNRPGGWDQGDAVAIGTDGTEDVSISQDQDDDNTTGRLFEMPAGGTSWNELTVSSWDGKRARSLASGEGTGGDRVLLAAVEDSGVWRWEGTARTQATGAATSGARLYWPSASDGHVYELASGGTVFCSSDSGQSFAQVNGLPAATALAADPSAPSRFYLSDGSGTVHAYSGGCSPDQGQTLSLAHANLMAAGPDGTLYALTSGIPWGVSFCNDVPCTPSSLWTAIDDRNFRAGITGANVFRASSDGLLYISNPGQGVIVGRR